MAYSFNPFSGGLDDSGTPGIPDAPLIPVDASLLLHMDGTEGSTNFIDSSPNNVSITAFGDVHIDTTTKMFGSGSGYFDGNEDYLRGYTVNDYTNDFTIEGWVFVTGLQEGITTIFEVGNIGSGVGGIHLYIDTEGKIVLNNGFAYAGDGGLIPQNQWVHFAVVRYNGINTLFLDGVSVHTDNQNYPVENGIFSIGAAPNYDFNFIGYIDDFRIVEGVAVYTDNFTPPTQQLEDVVFSNNLVYGRKNGQWLTPTKGDLLNAESGPYLTLVINGDNTVTGIEGSIGGYAYAERNDLLGLQIGRSCTSIGSYAFYGCEGFTGSLVIPDSVTTINTGAFFNSTGFNSLYLGSSITSIGDRAFFGCGGFTGSLTIPDSCTSIGSYAFYGCTGFTGSLTIGNSVTSIGDYAFGSCSGFNGSLTIGNSVTNIGSFAFYSCSGFNGSLTIGNSVTSIGINAFRDCSGFTGSLTIPNSITSIGSGAFMGCTGFTGSLTIPNSVTSIGSGAFMGCTGLTDYIVDTGNTVYSSLSGILTNKAQTQIISCLSGKTGSLTIPNSVTSIGNSAFQYCSGFTGSLTIPNSVTSIGDYAFHECSGFTGSLTIPNSITSIGIRVFGGCTGFTGSLTIPNSITSIGYTAFAFCTGFTGSLTIPNSITSIGNYAFYQCSNLTNVNCYIEKPIIDVAYRIFSNTGITTIHARATDATWTAGPGQTIGNKSGIEVIKDLT